MLRVRLKGIKLITDEGFTTPTVVVSLNKPISIANETIFLLNYNNWPDPNPNETYKLRYVYQQTT